MYFPVIRGKQFDLIALREMCKFISDDCHITPIIEPVKKTKNTLIKTISCLVESNITFTIIVNPAVGEYKNPEDLSGLINEIKTYYTNCQTGIIINQGTNILSIIKLIDKNGLSNLSIICDDLPNDLVAFNQLLGNKSIVNIVLNSSIQSNKFNHLIRSSKIDIIKLSDPFIQQDRNADYEIINDEFFSDEHLYYLSNGLKGFADYVTIGKPYSDSGFLPWAVAIHLTYLDDNEEFRIKHFVSDSNSDNSDVAGKFSEALEKLISFADEKDLNTYAISEFRTIYANGSYPGLGSLKKLSICHHLETVNEFLKNN